MIFLRLREWGTSEWTTARLDGALEETLRTRIFDLSDSLHVQMWNEEEEEWEEYAP